MRQIQRCAGTQGPSHCCGFARTSAAIRLLHPAIIAGCSNPVAPLVGAKRRRREGPRVRQRALERHFQRSEGNSALLYILPLHQLWHGRRVWVEMGSGGASSTPGDRLMACRAIGADSAPRGNSRTLSLLRLCSDGCRNAIAAPCKHHRVQQSNRGVRLSKAAAVGGSSSPSARPGAALSAL